MKRGIQIDKNNNLLDKKIQLAHKDKSLLLNNMSLFQIPQKALMCSQLRVINLGHNNIEILTPEIGNYECLEIIELNNNPLQYVPIELSQCLKLKSINLNDTFIKFLHMSLAELKYLTNISMENCPLKGKLKSAYSQGIVSVLLYLQRKNSRAIYKDLCIQKLHEWLYTSTPIENIQRLMTDVMNNLKDAKSDDLKKLYRNITHIFPPIYEDTDALQVRQKLFQKTDIKKITKRDIFPDME